MLSSGRRRSHDVDGLTPPEREVEHVGLEVRDQVLRTCQVCPFGPTRPLHIYIAIQRVEWRPDGWGEQGATPLTVLSHPQPPTPTLDKINAVNFSLFWSIHLVLGSQFSTWRARKTKRNNKNPLFLLLLLTAHTHSVLLVCPVLCSVVALVVLCVR